MNTVMNLRLLENYINAAQHQPLGQTKSPYKTFDNETRRHLAIISLVDIVWSTMQIVTHRNNKADILFFLSNPTAETKRGNTQSSEKLVLRMFSCFMIFHFHETKFK